VEQFPGTLAADPLVRQCPEGQLVPANLWFRNAPDGEMLREMKHTSDTFERVLSLLIVPRFEPRWACDGEEGRMTPTIGSSGAGGRCWGRAACDPLRTLRRLRSRRSTERD
jgi:hypothetical protein